MLKHPPDEQCWLLTGSQGEMGSALWRLANDKSTIQGLGQDDTLLVSARVIPGNERTMASLLDKIADKGVLIYDGKEGRHVSGHGHQEDMTALIQATKPRFFIPLHGGVQQLKAHRKVVQDLGLTEDQIIEIRNGQSVSISVEGDVHHLDKETSTEPWVNNGEVNYTPQDTVAARQRMSIGGLLLGVLSPGSDQIQLKGQALGAWDSEKLINRLQVKMTNFLMEHYDLSQEVLQQKLFRMVNDEFRDNHKQPPYFFIQ
jgi:ribonuclease J